MTEEEALKCDCPLTFNRAESVGDAELCIGSSCMAFRWGPKAQPERRFCGQPDKFTEVEPPRPSYVPDDWRFVAGNEEGDELPAHWVEPPEQTEERRPVYCGLAGKP